MTQICDPLDCTGCAACAQVCPVSCITMAPDDEGFLRPAIDASRCVGCKRCHSTCPANHETPRHEAPILMGWHHDEDVLRRCSSGGVFDALADIVLSEGGVVAGVAMDCETLELRHIMVEGREELEALRRSKYYQSDVGDIYLQVKRHLGGGRHVLFTGTPCQVAALYAVLGAELARSPKLVTMEILCHGVASKEVVRAYLKSKERRYGKKVIGYRFRIKEGERGWEAGQGTRLKIELLNDDGTTEEVVDPENTYMYGFNRNLFLRESCYRCRYCGTARVADFTAADFWGIKATRADEHARYWGVSLLLPAGERAQSLMPEVSRRMHIEEASPDEVLPYNLALTKPQERPELRSRVYQDLREHDYDRLLMRYYWRNLIPKKTKSIVKALMGPRMVKVVKRVLGKAS